MSSLVTLRSGRVVYVEKRDRLLYGDTQDTPDTPIIFIPGFVNTTKTYTPLIPYFSRYTTILYDIDGHGNTPTSCGPITAATLAADVDDILNHYGYEDAIVVGHSGGAIVAMQFGHDYPGRAKKLILMGPLPLPLPKEQIMRDASLVRTLPMDVMVKHVSQWLGPRAKGNQKILDMIKAETERHEQNREGVARVMEVLADFEYAGVGGAETIVIRGRHDTISHREAAESVCRTTKGRMVTLDTGHYFTWEDLDVTLSLKSLTSELTV